MGHGSIVPSDRHARLCSTMVMARSTHACPAPCPSLPTPQVDHPAFLSKVWGLTGSKLYGEKSGADYGAQPGCCCLRRAGLEQGPWQHAWRASQTGRSCRALDSRVESNSQVGSSCYLCTPSMPPDPQHNHPPLLALQWTTRSASPCSPARPLRRCARCPSCPERTAW